MSRSGPIVIVDDDIDDQEMIGRIFSKMKLENPIKKFNDGEQALRYLQRTHESPFLILCDINMPVMNGIQLKEQIDRDPDLRLRCIPFIFLSTAANPDEVLRAYTLSVQGYFVKGQSYELLKQGIEKIMQYWQTCIHPNNLLS
jgi:CheY-like chemotaxis protein